MIVRIPLILALLASLSTPATGRAQVVFNFATSNGGMTAAQTIGPPNPAGAWSYGTSFPSVGGTATWATAGAQAATAYALTTPALNVQANGQVTGSFLHRFSFETNFDGGVLMYAVNGGSFNKVAIGLLTGQVYNGSPGAGNPLTNLPGLVFTGTSPGYATPAYVTTGFTLGTEAAQTFAAGDSIQFQFLDGFDANTLGNPPNWQIGTLSLSNVAVPEPGSMVLGGLGLVGASIAGWRKRRAARVSHLSSNT
jgi:PEP-CTERM motif-containing protein